MKNRNKNKNGSEAYRRAILIISLVIFVASTIAFIYLFVSDYNFSWAMVMLSGVCFSGHIVYLILKQNELDKAQL
ncbi:hypothetical protein ACRN9F_23835 [Shewanella oncorhynchi]|uniref:hypothetical protein n=1 Tax=Shewanella oncorhynchi TaxID=2726434 RepID=UPI003D7A7CDF